METSFPFKSINGDRKYKADGWRDAFRPLFTKGVFPIGDPLKVTAGTGMTVKVSAGFAFIDGVTYHNPSEKTLPITVADGVLNRKDRVLIRINEENREATAVMLDGTLASSPVAPAIVWDDAYKDIALCTVTVNAGTTSMELAHLSDTRLDPAVCGVAAPYTVPDTSGWFAAWETEYLSWLQARQSAFDAWFETLASTLDENEAANLYNLITAHGSNHALDGIDPIPVGNLGGISFKVDQSLTDEEKARFRTNAGAVGATDILPENLGNNGVAELDDNEVVKSAQARAIVTIKTASYRLAATDAETLARLNSSSTINVELPNDSTCDFPVGTAFNFIRWGTGACTFSGQSGISWEVVNGATNISAQGSAALAVKVAANTWWLSCG